MMRSTFSLSTDEYEQRRHVFETHRLDQENRSKYLQRLNDPAFQFQTILIDPGGRRDETWGGWQYVYFGKEVGMLDEAMLLDEKRVADAEDLSGV